MHNNKLNSPKGVGVGSLFSGLTREIIPVSKFSIENLNKVMGNKSMKKMGKTLQEEATNTAVEDTINFLNKKKLKNQKKSIKKSCKENFKSNKKKEKINFII